MLWAIARFELKKRLGLVSTYVYAGILFLLGWFMLVASAGLFQSVSVSVGGGKVMANGPVSLQQFTSFVTYLGLLIIAALMGHAVLQDFEHDTSALFFTAPIKKRDYLLGRMVGSLLVVVAIFSAIGFGEAFGTVTPGIDKSLIQSAPLTTYLVPYLTSVLPNVIFAGGLFFALATATRKIMPVYVTCVVMLIGYLIAGNLIQQLDRRLLAALLDPFGVTAIHELTRYWTPVEKNARMVPLAGPFLWNRVLWTSIGLSLFGFVYARFRFEHRSGAEGRSANVIELPKEEPLPRAESTRPVTSARLLVKLTSLAFRETVKNIYFPVMVLAGVLFMLVTSYNLGSLFGTRTYPVTGQLLRVTGGSFELFVIIITVFYAGELTWRERDHRVDQLMDASPIPGWVSWLSKLLALFQVQVVLLAVVMVTSMAIQAFKGYFHFEPLLYLKDLFGIRLIEYCLLCVLALVVQSVIQNKYLGYFAMVLYMVGDQFLPALGFQHHLYDYGSTPPAPYSDMNGFGHFLYGVYSFDAYWAAMAVLLAVAIQLTWIRGVETGPSARLRVARTRWTGPWRLTAAVAAVAFVALGGFIFWNTNVLNHYRSEFQNDELKAQYEKRYKSLADVPQPRITAETVALDLDPARRHLDVRGTFQLLNKTSQPVTRVFVNLPEEAKIRSLMIGDGVQASASDKAQGFYTFDLPAPLAPGGTSKLTFDLEYAQRGFTNGQGDTSVVENGTFFNSGVFPHLGYQEDAELSDDQARKRHGLAPKERMADVADLKARQNTYIANDADWIDFEATISTAPDQRAIAPGYLQKEWVENGRRYFTYKTTNKILNFTGFLSARYAVKRDAWKDVAIEIDYQPGHTYDLDRMIAGIQETLEYASTNFSPYQHKQVRILEFPRYHQFAQSFPNTIPFSESVGFIAYVNPNDPDDVDYPFYISAHEVAHQWWAHQVIGGNVQGATMLSESMAQYTALMVMKHHFGEAGMRRFLKYELDRYLFGRATERKKELPLERVENQQYIHYQKGSLAMYALQDAIGEDAVNRALAGYIQKVAFQEPPYTNSLELVAALKAVTPPDRQYLIHDLFETITLYENRAVSATAKPAGADGEYDVTMKVIAKKVRADEKGAETPVPLNDLIDVGVLDENGKALALEKKRITAENAEFTVHVKGKPAKAGIDPLNKLIDRSSSDNVVKVEGI